MLVTPTTLDSHSTKRKHFDFFWNRARAMSKFLFDSMLPKYTQFQPFISSQLSSSVASLSHNNNNNISSANNQNNSSALTTSTSEGSPLTSSEGSPSSPATTATNKMYPYVTNHSSSHTGLSGMPGFSSLDDKNQCRYVRCIFCFSFRNFHSFVAVVDKKS